MFKSIQDFIDYLKSKNVKDFAILDCPKGIYFDGTLQIIIQLTKL